MIALLDNTEHIAQQLEPKLHERLPEAVLEIFTSFEALQYRLSCLHGDPAIAILSAETNRQLEKFKELQLSFADVRIVLILSDNDSETLRLGHQLYPRFIIHKSGDLDALVEVVARMHGKMDQIPYS